jgi:hypothetical protein
MGFGLVKLPALSPIAAPCQAAIAASVPPAPDLPFNETAPCDPLPAGLPEDWLAG